MLRNLLTVLCLGIVAMANAQITIVSTDLPTVPDTLRNAVDTLPAGVAPGPKGANQTWNFANAVQDIVEPSYYRLPSSTPYAADFSSATHAVTPNNSNYGYFQNTTNAFTCQGLAGDLLNNGTTVSVQFTPTFDLYRFPVTYNNNFTQTYGFTETANNVTVPGVPFPVYQVRVVFTSTFYDTIDAWGNVVTPLGTYNSIRQVRKEYSYTNVDYKLTAISPWDDAADLYDTTLTYSWLAKETQGPVATMNVKTNGTVTRLSYSLTPPAPVADFAWTNPSGGLVQFTDQSTNGPTSWSWDYDDGSALGTMQNPNHIYGANATYNVCLTVSNSTGSDTHCENVTVSNISAGNNAPVAVNDSANTNFNTDVTVFVLGNDIDPDGDNISNSGAFGSNDGTVVVNGDGSVTFTPDAGFSGWASFQYSICDDGTPSLCDTATVYVEVAPAPVSADFTFADSCLIVSFENTSVGYTGLVAWTFGDGNNALGETTTHTYTEPGTYLACVTVNGTAGGTDSTCYAITVDTCTTIGISRLNDVAISVYPNPAQGQVTVVVPNGSKGGKLAIINNLGMLVKEVEVTTNRSTINITDLASGIYHLAYTGREGTLGAGRFVKQ